MKRHLLVLVVLLVASLLGTAWAQVGTTTAQLKGRATDQSRAVLPGVTITITDVEKGISRTVATDDRGEYMAQFLAPTTYEVKAELKGFATQIKKGITLTVGQGGIIDFEMTVSQVATEVVVTGEAPLIETERIQQSDTIDKRNIDNLPINGRNYLDFVLLTPGVTDSKSIADNTDFRVAQTPNTGLSFAGNNGRGNSVTMDGAENNYASGGVRSTLGQEAIQEFQINRSNMTAEVGGASGGIINIVSKSGGNELHGNIFGFLRNRKLDARNFFDPVDSPFTRAQYGITVGGPIRRDRTFFFSAFERQDRNESAFVTFPRDPSNPIFQLSSSQSAFFNFLGAIPNFAPLATGLKQNLTGTNFPSTLNLFKQNAGAFPFSSDASTFSTKLDHKFSDNNTAFLRFHVTDSLSENAEFGALIATSRGRGLDVLDSSILLSDTHFFSARAINEMRIQWAYFRFNVIPNDPIGPEFNIAGFGQFNRDIFLPSKSYDRRYQVLDNFSYTAGRHSWKFGVDYNPYFNSTTSNTFFGGRFNFGPLPLVLLVPSAVTPALVQFLFTNPAAAAFSADANKNRIPDVLDAPISSLQAFNLGLAQVYQQGFGDPKFAAWTHQFNWYVQDHYKVASNFTLDLGLRYELQILPQPLNRDTNNFAPRFGFSWDPWRNGKTTIRGGYGIFYSPVYFQIPNVLNELGGRGNPSEINIVLTTIRTAGAQSSANIFQTLSRQGIIGKRTITAADIAQFGITPRPGLPLEVRFREQPEYVNPYSQQASFGMEREIVHNLSVSANYLFNRALKVTRARDVNILPGTAGNFCVVPGVVCANFVNPLRFQDNVYESSGEATYHAMTLSLNKRYGGHVAFNVHYTWSRAIDEVTDFNSDFQPNDQTNVRAERSLSAFHQEHRLVAFGMLDLPLGFSLSPIVTIGSTRPFNLLAGSDLNSDRHSTTDRPPTAGRNTGIGPNFRSFDLRVRKLFNLDDEGKRRIEFLFEAFNLFNRVNFASVNNVVGAIPPPFNLKGTKDRTPTDARGLGFTSAFDPRQLQLGLKFVF